MQIKTIDLEGVLLLSPPAYPDERGSFSPIFASRLHQAAGITGPWSEVNASHTKRGCIRGLHWQTGPPQAKLVSVTAGSVFDVVVDLRPASPTLGKWAGFRLSADGGPSQIFIPAGFAHGFATPEEAACIVYLVSAPWYPDAERVLAWNDPHLAIPWPLDQPVLSARDRQGLSLVNALAEYPRRNSP